MKGTARSMYYRRIIFSLAWGMKVVDTRRRCYTCICQVDPSTYYVDCTCTRKLVMQLAWTRESGGIGDKNSTRAPFYLPCLDRRQYHLAKLRTRIQSTCNCVHTCIVNKLALIIGFPQGRKDRSIRMVIVVS
jgi:hypothetical protein